MSMNLPKRDGMTTLINLAKTMCRLVQIFKPVILEKYGANIAIMALVTAIDGLCEALPQAQQAFYEPLGDNVDIEENPENTPGINPAAPPEPPQPE